MNAANETLLGGGGVDGAIHRAAGPALLAECRKLRGCETGEAKITGGYRLPAAHVIHTVGPVWYGGNDNEDELLASCYRRSFETATDNGIRSIAFPAVSTGDYAFPKERAAQIAIREVTCLLAAGEATDSINQVLLVSFSQKDFDVMSSALDAFRG